MKVFYLLALFLVVCVGCGEGGTEVVADQDELAAYIAENPSPTDEELMAQNTDADE